MTSVIGVFAFTYAGTTSANEEVVEDQVVERDVVEIVEDKHTEIIQETTTEETTEYEIDNTIVNESDIVEELSILSENEEPVVEKLEQDVETMNSHEIPKVEEHYQSDILTEQYNELKEKTSKLGESQLPAVGRESETPQALEENVIQEVPSPLKEKELNITESIQESEVSTIGTKAIEYDAPTFVSIDSDKLSYLPGDTAMLKVVTKDETGVDSVSVSLRNASQNGSKSLYGSTYQSTSLGNGLYESIIRINIPERIQNTYYRIDNIVMYDDVYSKSISGWNLDFGLSISKIDDTLGTLEIPKLEYNLEENGNDLYSHIPYIEYANDFPTEVDETTNFIFEFQVPKSSNVEIGGYYHALKDPSVIQEVIVEGEDYNILTLNLELGEEGYKYEPYFYRYDKERNRMYGYNIMVGGGSYEDYVRSEDDYNINSTKKIKFYNENNELLDETTFKGHSINNQLKEYLSNSTSSYEIIKQYYENYYVSNTSNGNITEADLAIIVKVNPLFGNYIYENEDIPYETIYIEDDNFPEGESYIGQYGMNGYIEKNIQFIT